MRTTKNVRKWIAWWCLRSEEQLNLRFQGDFSPLLFLPHLLPQRNISRKCPKKWGELPMNTLFYDFTDSPALPTIAEWTSNQHKGKCEEISELIKELFESFLFCSSQKEPCVFWSRFNTVCPNVPTDQWISVKILSILCFSYRKCYCFSLCLHTILIPPSLLMFCSFNIQID